MGNNEGNTDKTCRKQEKSIEEHCPRRGKMDKKQRAKQFMPFAALKGLDEALSEEELKREE